ncbi:MAG: hypothetical protein LKF54_05450 [Bacilli bacterium]|jgi:hypothetical protein|nr:hypothetical protein [Bacilli bacterium]
MAKKQSSTKVFAVSLLIGVVLIGLAGGAKVLNDKYHWTDIFGSSSETTSDTTSDDSSSDSTSEVTDLHPFPTTVYTLMSLGGESEAWTAAFTLDFDEANKQAEVSASTYKSWSSTFNATSVIDTVVGQQQLTLSSNWARYDGLTGPLKLGWASSAPSNMDVAEFAGEASYYSYLIFEFAIGGAQNISVLTDPASPDLVTYARTASSEWQVYSEEMPASTPTQFAFVFRGNALSSSQSINSISINLSRED